MGQSTIGAAIFAAIVFIGPCSTDKKNNLKYSAKEGCELYVRDLKEIAEKYDIGPLEKQISERQWCQDPDQLLQDHILAVTLLECNMSIVYAEDFIRAGKLPEKTVFDGDRKFCQSSINENIWREIDRYRSDNGKIEERVKRHFCKRGTLDYYECRSKNLYQRHCEHFGRKPYQKDHKRSNHQRNHKMKK